MPSSCPKHTFLSEGWIPNSIILQNKPQHRGRADTAEITRAVCPTRGLRIISK